MVINIKLMKIDIEALEKGQELMAYQSKKYRIYVRLENLSKTRSPEKSAKRNFQK